MARKKTSTDFEHALKELEALLERLEQGDLPLEESLKLFERGMALTRACQQTLKEAEQKVEILTNRRGHETVETFSPSGDPDDGN